MIELKNVSKTYMMGESAVHALQDVSLKIEQGDFIAVIGPSGSGKSTLLHILGFLDTPDSGEYLFLDKKVSGFSDDDLAMLRNQTAGFIFQQFHLLRRMSALDNVALPYIYSPGENHQSKQKALENLGEVGLKDRASHWSSELSGGQQQRVAIARALIKDPMIIFADEPTGNLDTKSEEEIIQILFSLNEQGKTVIMVTHEREVAEHARRIISMRDGKIISDERRRDIDVQPKGHNSEKLSLIPRPVWQKEEFLGHLRQAVNAIMSNKVRSLLSMLGILVGVAAVIAMLALGTGAQRAMEKQLESLGSNLLSVRGGQRQMGGAASSGLIARFSFDDVNEIRGLTPYVSNACGFVRGTVQAVYANENTNTSLEGVGYDYGKMRSYIPSVGRWFTQQEIDSRQKVAVIGVTVSRALFGDNVSPLGKTIKLNRINFRVIGVFPAKGSSGPHDQDDAVLIPVTTAAYRVLGKDYLDGIYVEISDPSLMEEGKSELEKLIRKRHRVYHKDEDSFNIRDMSEIQDMLKSTTKTMSLLLGCIAAISLFVGGIGIMNIMLVSVTERTKEIGLRKAIGARRVDILMQFLIEAVVMTLSGGLLGVTLGIGAAFLLSLMAGWATHVSISSICLATVFSIAVGVGFGIWPAQKASQLNPIEALRYE